MGEDHAADAIRYFMGNWYEDYKESELKTYKEARDFEQLFHIGVKLRQVNSKLEWTIIEIKEDANGLWARIRSPKGYHKWISGSFYRSYEPSYMPDAVRVLYGK